MFQTTNPNIEAVFSNAIGKVSNNVNLSSTQAGERYDYVEKAGEFVQPERLMAVFAFFATQNDEDLKNLGTSMTSLYFLMYASKPMRYMCYSANISQAAIWQTFAQLERFQNIIRPTFKRIRQGLYIKSEIYAHFGQIAEATDYLNRANAHFEELSCAACMQGAATDTLCRYTQDWQGLSDIYTTVLSLKDSYCNAVPDKREFVMLTYNWREKSSQGGSVYTDFVNESKHIGINDSNLINLGLILEFQTLIQNWEGGFQLLKRQYPNIVNKTADEIKFVFGLQCYYFLEAYQNITENTTIASGVLPTELYENGANAISINDLKNRCHSVMTQYENAFNTRNENDFYTQRIAHRQILQNELYAFANFESKSEVLA